MRIALAALALVGACYCPALPHTACPARRATDHDMGVVADPLSPLSTSEVRVGGEYGQAGEENREELTAWTPLIGARYTGDNITIGADWNPVYYADDERAEDGLGDDGRASAGNLRIAVGYKSKAARLGGLYRRGYATQVALGVDLFDTDGDFDETALGNRLGDLRPFERTRFSSGQYFEQRFDARYELVGCHAPFVHVSTGYLARKDLDRHTFSFPASITVGAHPNPSRHLLILPRITVYGGYDVLVGRQPTIDDDWRTQHRIRAGLQLEELHLRLEYATVLGPSDGAMYGAYIVVPIRLGENDS